MWMMNIIDPKNMIGAAYLMAIAARTVSANPQPTK